MWFLNTSKLYGSPQPVTGDSFTFLYVDDFRTSRERHLRASTACYEDSFIFLYADDICTSWETRFRVFTACYVDIFTLNIIIAAFLLSPRDNIQDDYFRRFGTFQS
jgi:hypothetical protein